MFKVSKEKLTKALESFYETNSDKWGEYSTNMEEISDKIIHRIYAGEQPEKLYENGLTCIVGAIVYEANNKLEEKVVKQKEVEEKEVVEKKSFRDIEKIIYDCRRTAINDTHKRIREKIGDIYEFTIEELIDMVFPETVDSQP